LGRERKGESSEIERNGMGKYYGMEREKSNISTAQHFRKK